MIASNVVEQRISHFLMGLAILGTMTGPLLVVLHTIPRSLFAGVFFVVGVRSPLSQLPTTPIQSSSTMLTFFPRPLQWGSIESNGIMQKLVYLISEPRYIQRSEPMRQVSKKKIGLFISFQLFGVLSSVAISQTLAAIGEPTNLYIAKAFSHLLEMKRFPFIQALPHISRLWEI